MYVYILCIYTYIYQLVLYTDYTVSYFVKINFRITTYTIFSFTPIDKLTFTPLTILFYLLVI